MTDSEPKLHIDSDWKAEAQAEKERLARESEAREQERQGEGELPEASFRGLLSILATPAIMSLGTQRDPKTGGAIVDLEGARFYIDLLSVLESKTTGNLSEEEAKELTTLIHELRGRFVEVTHLVAQSAQQGQGGGTPTPGDPSGGPAGIITPD